MTHEITNLAIHSEEKKLIELVEHVLADAKKMGATDAEVSVGQDNGFTVNVRMGDVDTLEYHRSKGIGITVYFGHKKGSVSTTDINKESLHTAVEKACSIAKFADEDPYSGLADKQLMAVNYPDLDLYHPWSINPAEAIELAKNCEARGRAADQKITNSEGAHVTTHEGISVYGNSNGFIGSFPSTSHSLTLVLIASDNQSMQRDYGYTVARSADNLMTWQQVADEAANKALKRLGARKLTTRKSPVIFSPDMAAGLINSFIAAIRGSNLYRKSSFLLDHLGKPVFPEFISICEKPHLKKGLASAPFDAEGVATREQYFIKDGVLSSYVLGSYSARKLGMQTTANAGGVHNLFISTSNKNFTDLLKEMNTGLLVTEVMGQGVNIVTGDYSRGASGFWVENGELQYPVEEITIAGNLRDMYQNLVLVGNDIDERNTIHTGSMLLSEMMIAGD